MHFISPKILNAWAILAIWNSDVNILQDYFFQNGGQSPMGNDFNKHFIILLLFSPFYIFDFEASALNWSHVFHKVWYLWKWSPVCYCTFKMFCLPYYSPKQCPHHVSKTSNGNLSSSSLKKSCIFEYKKCLYKIVPFFLLFVIVIWNNFDKWKNAVGTSKGKSKIWTNMY